MRYKYIFRKFLNETREYKSLYPEHKPPYKKLIEMGKSIEDLRELLERNKNFILKKFRDKETMNALGSKYEVIYKTLDFDITEEYIWFVAELNRKTDGLEAVKENRPTANEIFLNMWSQNE